MTDIPAGQDRDREGPSISCPYCTATIFYGNEGTACEHFGGWTLSDPQNGPVVVVGAQFTNLYSHESEYLEIVPT